MLKWEKALIRLNQEMERVNLLSSAAMDTRQFSQAVEYFRAMADLNSRKACMLRKISRTHKNKQEREMMIDSARLLFQGRAEWIRHAEMVTDSVKRLGESI